MCVMNEDERKKKRRETSARYRAKHPERIAEYSRSYRKRNPEAARAAQERYEAKYPGRRAEISRRYRERHLEAERKRKRDEARRRYASPEWYFKYIERYYGPGAGDHYRKRLAEQNGMCAICQLVPVKGKLHLDHNHGSKQLRGLLCGDCNRGLGMFKENVEYLKRLIEYIEKWGISSLAA
jgi:hypothetical protein